MRKIFAGSASRSAQGAIFVVNVASASALSWPGSPKFILNSTGLPSSSGSFTSTPVMVSPLTF